MIDRNSANEQGQDSTPIAAKRSNNGVVGILIAYNPDLPELFDNVERLVDQVDWVIVGNNSIAPLTVDDPRVQVLNFGRNIGIAAAQTVSMGLAFGRSAKFVLQMDQDSVLYPGTVSSLLELHRRLSDSGYCIGIVGPSHRDKETGLIKAAKWDHGRQLLNGEVTVVSAMASSGSLISREAYQMVGGMEDRLFIDAVDFEYNWRLKSQGFLTVRANEVVLGHRLGQGEHDLLGVLSITVPTPVRHYYHLRNVFLLLPRDYVPFRWKVSNLVKLAFKLLVYPFLFSDGRTRVTFMLKGVFDGLVGRGGPINDRRNTKRSRSC